MTSLSRKNGERTKTEFKKKNSPVPEAVPTKAEVNHWHPKRRKKSKGKWIIFYLWPHVRVRGWGASTLNMTVYHIPFKWTCGVIHSQVQLKNTTNFLLRSSLSISNVGWEHVCCLFFFMFFYRQGPEIKMKNKMDTARKIKWIRL